jgi:rubrerythrin
MAIRFNADEVLGMAEQIEENGAKFYRKAAKLASSKEDAAFLTKLATMEDGHKATFTAMRKSLPSQMREETAADPYMEATLYANAVADSHGGEGSPAAADELTGKETMKDILLMAVAAEQRSIVFYLGLIDMVPPKLGKSKIEDIIAEEKSHIVVLAAELKKLQQA